MSAILDCAEYTTHNEPTDHASHANRRLLAFRNAHAFPMVGTCWFEFALGESGWFLFGELEPSLRIPMTWSWDPEDFGGEKHGKYLLDEGGVMPICNHTSTESCISPSHGSLPT